MSRVKFLAKFENLDFSQFLKICNIDFVLFTHLMWIASMGNQGAAGGISERRRSSCSSWSRSCLIITKNDKMILADSEEFPQNISFRIKDTTWCRTLSMIYSQLNWLAEDNRTIFIILYTCLDVWCTRQMYLYTCLEMYILEHESCSMCLKLSDIILKTSTFF